MLSFKQASNAVKIFASIFQFVNRLVIDVKKKRNVKTNECKKHNAINKTRT